MRTGIVTVGCAILAVICLSSIASAQTSWWRTYGGSSRDWGYSVQQTADGGYIVAGQTFSFGAGWYDVYLIKTNVSGDTLWTRTYGGTGHDEGYSVQQTLDGGYIVTGSTGPEVYLIKTNAAGDTLWTRAYGGRWENEGYSVQQTAGGGYIVTGVSNSTGGASESANVYLLKTDVSGETLWTRAYGGTTDDRGYSVQQTADGGYIIAGKTESFGAGDYDAYLIKTNDQGDTLWTKTYGGTRYDEGYSVRQTSDGGYIVAGYTESFGAWSGDVYLVKTDPSGETLWTRTYGGTYEDGGRSVQQTVDNGYIIAGYAASFGAGDWDIYLVKTDASGDTLWTRTYGGTDGDGGYSIQQTGDGGYIIAGYTISFGAGSDDVYLIKTDSLGSVGVAEEGPKPRVMRGRLGTTVLSGASGVRQLASCVAFDAMGRRALHPKPGIYFVNEPQAQAQVQAVRKVLLVK